MSNTNSQVLLITPPFTQLNTPYPATAYIKGFLNTIGVSSTQMDLGLDTILALFSKEGLTKLFESITDQDIQSENSHRIFNLQLQYIATIDPVISFLQNADPTLSHLICERHYLPEASKFAQLDDLEWAFGTMGIRDRARHLATLYLEDISDFIVENVDPHFGFSRYAERLSLSAGTFDGLYQNLNQNQSIIVELMLKLLDTKLQKLDPQLVCFSVPFPGNLFAALKSAQWIKQKYPTIKVAMGGGYPNTELRSLSDSRVFEFIDFITLDDGETPLMNLLEYIKGERDIEMLKRTFVLKEGQVKYYNGSLHSDVKQEKVGTPDYEGLSLKSYLSVIQLTNPMHRLWSDGRWNKLTMAHGCYWGKCTFCDISLDYIGKYEASSAVTIVNRMETLIAQTGERGFHFVDEAAPPALMKAVAIEILRRSLTVTWWTNIRFEKSFSYDLCRLLSHSGCVAVSGGLEVASDRLLKLIAKGVTVEQVAQVNDNFTRAGIMVHAYLMYGFPTQTAQETIDSLEVVRQMFETGVMQSGFWHRFAMTAHSPVGLDPAAFKVSADSPKIEPFANNDLQHTDPEGCDHSLFSEGLKKSNYNYMHGVCIDHPLQNWFDHRVPNTTHAPDLIQRHINAQPLIEAKPSSKVIWIGGPVQLIKEGQETMLRIDGKSLTQKLSLLPDTASWLVKTLEQLQASDSKTTTLSEVKQSYQDRDLNDFTLFWYGEVMENLKQLGLVVM